MRDKEDSTASLGDAEELSIKDAPGVPTPEFCQGPDDGSHVPSVV